MLLSNEYIHLTKFCKKSDLCHKTWKCVHTLYICKKYHFFYCVDDSLRTSTTTGERPVLAGYQFSPPRVQRMHACCWNIIVDIFRKPGYCSIECINKISYTDNHTTATHTVARTGTRRELLAHQYYTTNTSTVICYLQHTLD
jgi:hypothetical protein